ncbi:MFS transporter [Vibrio algarum]|uniref:MFS transporter n=1 Tax=Vibrio algarum TaxID=3020714 RepID=A0ABT4YRU1_9VIBR|nr:MFS transporter [Vibrio sp. KJ40-1]MDB1124233.1 MFS transporter [Vibrio sp. KJ40-1]
MTFNHEIKTPFYDNDSHVGALYLANALTLTGNSLTAIAIPWFIHDVTGSAMATAGVVLAGQLPHILASLFSGPFIDRFSPLKVSIGCDVINFLAVVAIPLFYSVGITDILFLTVMVFLSQVFDIPGNTSKQVMLADMIDRYGLPRERANGVNSLIETGCDVIGPVIATGLLSLVGVLSLLYLDAITFLISAFLVARFIRLPKKIHADLKHSGYVQLVQSCKWVLKKPALIRLAVYGSLLNLIAVALLALVIPVIGKEVFQKPMWLGIWMSSFAIGTVVSASLYTLLGTRANTVKLLQLAPVLQCLGLTLMAFCLLFFTSSITGGVLIATALFVYGSGLGVGGVLDAIVLQTNVTSVHRGTVFSLFGTARYAGVPFGLLLAGYFLEHLLYVELIFLLSGISLIASALWLGARHTMDETTSTTDLTRTTDEH